MMMSNILLLRKWEFISGDASTFDYIKCATCVSWTASYLILLGMSLELTCNVFHWSSFKTCLRLVSQLTYNVIFRNAATHLTETNSSENMLRRSQDSQRKSFPQLLLKTKSTWSLVSLLLVFLFSVPLKAVLIY